MLLSIEGVTVKFDSLIAVNNVSVNIAKGKITGLIGPNGAGKTTLVNAISGVYAPNAGKVVFDGEDITGRRGYQISKAGLARTYQVINLFEHMTVLENVLVGMHTRLKSSLTAAFFKTRAERAEEEAAREKAFELLRFVRLQDRFDNEAGSLSYGDQRRLEIIRGLASDPKMVLLDEPAAGMNPVEKDDLDAMLREIINRGVTVLMIEHDMKLMMGVADHVFVLNYGSKLAEGTPAEIQRNPDVITAYLGDD
ncbi:ABC transporter ATP-binding protein [Synergistales bacterium]|nr:ABC transporter ATP-binding protein [Synergistales bacterium]